MHRGKVTALNALLKNVLIGETETIDHFFHGSRTSQMACERENGKMLDNH